MYFVDAWIVTGGTNAGVMQLVGGAVKNYMDTHGAVEKEIVALGIVPWGVVHDKEKLIDKVCDEINIQWLIMPTR